MLKRHWPLLLGALVFAAVLAWLLARSPRDSAKVTQADTRLPAPTVTSAGTVTAPVRVIEQRPPAARDGTLVVSEYGFVGAIGDESGGTRYLFTRGDQTYSLSIGGVLDGAWRVESVEPDRVRLTRLADGVAGVIPYSSAGSGSLELPSDATVRSPTPRPTSRRSLHSRHP
jgi:hypothetical protein